MRRLLRLENLLDVDGLPPRASASDRVFLLQQCHAQCRAHGRAQIMTRRLAPAFRPPLRRRHSHSLSACWACHRLLDACGWDHAGLYAVPARFRGRYYQVMLTVGQDRRQSQEIEHRQRRVKANDASGLPCAGAAYAQPTPVTRRSRLHEFAACVLLLTVQDGLVEGRHAARQEGEFGGGEALSPSPGLTLLQLQRVACTRPPTPARQCSCSRPPWCLHPITLVSATESFL